MFGGEHRTQHTTQQVISATTVFQGTVSTIKLTTLQNTHYATQNVQRHQKLIQTHW